MDWIRRLLKEAMQIITHVGVATVALGSDTEVPVFKAPCAGRITKIGVVPKAAATGDDTDNFTLSCQNKGADGTGTDEICSKAYVTGVDLTAFDFDDLGTLANKDLAKDDTVTFLKVEAGLGLAMPDLIVVVEFKPDLKKW